MEIEVKRDPQADVNTGEVKIINIIIAYIICHLLMIEKARSW